MNSKKKINHMTQPSTVFIDGSNRMSLNNTDADGMTDATSTYQPPIIETNDGGNR